MKKFLSLKGLIIHFKKLFGHNQIVVICFALASINFSNAQELDAISLQMKRHVVGNTFAITSDQDGFTWLATLYGIVRFDGQKFILL